MISRYLCIQHEAALYIVALNRWNHIVFSAYSATFLALYILNLYAKVHGSVLRLQAERPDIGGECQTQPRCYNVFVANITAQWQLM